MATTRGDGSTRAILLDFDEPEAVSQVMTRFPFVARQLALTVETVFYSRSSSGTGFHVVILLREYIPAKTAISLQLICGSDWRRETFNIVRVKHLRGAPTFWRKRWNVLYAKKFRRPDDRPNTDSETETRSKTR